MKLTLKLIVLFDVSCAYLLNVCAVKNICLHKVLAVIKKKNILVGSTKHQNSVIGISNSHDGVADDFEGGV